MKRKNWKLFKWALLRLKLDPGNNDIIYKKCFRNDILLRLMDLSGVTPMDATYFYSQIDDELKRRAS